MSTIQGRSRIGTDGTLHVKLPGLAETEVEFVLEVAPAHAVGMNGHQARPPVPISTEMTDEEWRAFVRETAGSMPDFPSIERSKQERASPAKAMTDEEWRARMIALGGSSPDFPNIDSPGADSYEKRDEW